MFSTDCAISIDSFDGRAFESCELVPALDMSGGREKPVAKHASRFTLLHRQYLVPRTKLYALYRRLLKYGADRLDFRDPPVLFAPCFFQRTRTLSKSSRSPLLATGLGLATRHLEPGQACPRQPRYLGNDQTAGQDVDDGVTRLIGCGELERRTFNTGQFCWWLVVSLRLHSTSSTAKEPVLRPFTAYVDDHRSIVPSTLPTA
nr:hypothetical protein CFP56_36404 [Quercus suber]